jgi:hypothetical protein
VSFELKIVTKTRPQNTKEFKEEEEHKEEEEEKPRTLFFAK